MYKYVINPLKLGNRRLIVGAWGAYNQELGPKELPHTTPSTQNRILASPDVSPAISAFGSY